MEQSAPQHARNNANRRASGIFSRFLRTSHREYDLNIARRSTQATAPIAAPAAYPDVSAHDAECAMLCCEGAASPFALRPRPTKSSIGSLLLPLVQQKGKSFLRRVAMRVYTRTRRMVVVAMRVEDRFCLRTRKANARVRRAFSFDHHILSHNGSTFRLLTFPLLLSFEYEWERAERLHDRHRETQKNVR